jgi:[NiFe] hydrogenase large subunit/hydrogenase large subunit
MHAILGGKNPHLQSFLVGGMATPIDPDQQASINVGTIAAMRSLVAKAQGLRQPRLPPRHPRRRALLQGLGGPGAGVGNYMVYGEYPENDSGKPPLYIPSGVIFGRKLQVYPLDTQKITEQVTHSWYDYAGGDGKALHPSQGETRPNYTGPKPPYERLDTSAKYSWLKSPRYDGKPMEVGPLARMLVAYLSGHERVKELVDLVLGKLAVGPEALFSTLGRIAARGIETQVLVDKMGDWLDELTANMGPRRAGHPRQQQVGSRDLAEGRDGRRLPRGAARRARPLGAHRRQKIANYQCIVPSTWNAGPRDAQNQPGPYEAALVGTPVANPSSRSSSCAPSTRSTRAWPAASTWSTSSAARWRT